MRLSSTFSARNRTSLVAYAFSAYLMSTAVMAGSVGGGGLSVVKTFLDNIGTILNAASIVVVTIAIIFAGYQISFNNKRISEVAPVLIGGVLIGGAGQIASMLIAGGTVGSV